MKWYKNIWAWLSVAIAGLNMADAYTTLYGINSGLVREFNPLMRYVLNGSHSLFIAIKIFFSVVIFLYLYKTNFRTKFFIILMFILFLLTVLNNCIVIFIAKALMNR